MAQSQTSARVLLLLHSLHPDWQIPGAWADIVPDYDEAFFRAVCYRLQLAGALEYSTATKRRLVTTKGQGLMPQVVELMKRDANMPDCKNMHALARAFRETCQREQADWQIENRPDVAAVFAGLPQQMQETINHAN